MKNWLAFVALPTLLAAAPTPLVVGSVRDQYGAPVVGADVASALDHVETSADGTFALRAAGVRSVTVTCSYCRSTTASVADGEPVVVLIQRYDAVAQQTPSDRDLAYAPNSQAASIASLHPFVVLNESSSALPGSRLSDRGTSARGALLLDDGIPSYDVVSNASAFDLFPSYSAQHVAWRSPADAFLYGDLAGAGTVAIDTQAEDAANDFVFAGSPSTVHAGARAQNAAWSAALSHDDTQTGDRADLSLLVPLGEDALHVSARTAGDRLTATPQNLDTNGSGIRLDYDRVRQNAVHASLVADAGAYELGSSGADYRARWSDVQAQGGFTTTGRIALFGEAAIRASSGSYAGPYGTPGPLAGVVSQTQVDLGVQTTGDRYRLRAGLGSFGVASSGGAGGAKRSLYAAVLLPSFDGSYAFDAHWNLEAQASASFALPTLLETYAGDLYTASLPLDRNATYVQTLSYGDLHRLRVSITSMSERTSGLDNGTAHAQGASVAWQFAPSIALRAWVLHENDTTQPYQDLYRFGARPIPGTVGSYWLTYDGSGMRIDAIYRRDLLDYQPNPHLDASLSTPIGHGLRLFAATQRVGGRRLALAGLRFQAP